MQILHKRQVGENIENGAKHLFAFSASKSGYIDRFIRENGVEDFSIAFCTSQ